MRARVATLLSLLVICFALPASIAQAETVTFAQVGEEDEAEGEGGNVGEGEGQSDPEAETGAGEGEQEGGASAEEEGPPWTYQMARIGIALMVLIGLLMGLLYYRMIASRQRAT